MTDQQPPIPPVADMTTLVVRGFGYEVHHVVTVPVTSLLSMRTHGSDFTGVRTPVVARCGRQVRSVNGTLVVMQAGTPTTCRQCRMFSGVERQPHSPLSAPTAPSAAADT